jgi:hypothetical protein
MHAHTDKPCKHDLKVCTDCGNVYCAKCSKEWFKEQKFYYSYQPYTYVGTGTPPTITYYGYTAGTYTAPHIHTQ